MKYEFHVGDYIESFDGSVGYLTKVETWYSGTVGNDVVHLQGSTTFDASCGFTPVYNNHSSFRYFKIFQPHRPV